MGAKVVLVVVGLMLSGCGGATPEKLAGDWSCNGSERSFYNFKADGQYLREGPGDPNAKTAAERSSSEVSGSYKIDGSTITMTPNVIRVVVAQEDFSVFLLALNSGDRLQHVQGRTFEISPGAAQSTMALKLSGDTLAIQVTKQVDARGKEVLAPPGGWKSFECTKSAAASSKLGSNKSNDHHPNI